jgi:transglutaminase-like putative cysteine protease
VRYEIIHTTSYAYNRAVTFDPHVLRLRSRNDCTQMLHDFHLQIAPEPIRISDIIDLEGNDLVKVWFDQTSDRLEFTVKSEVETFRRDPFNFLLEPWAVRLPIDYPEPLRTQLHCYLHPLGTPSTVDPVVAQLAHEIWQDVAGSTTAFVCELNERLHENCRHQVRETGPPLEASVTWTQKQGSCRDVAVLFMETCRVMGLAARFVSGYQQGNPNWKRRHLHAWVEVYFPGGGWRGYDPTQGMAVGDRHVALVASAIPKQAAPISGTFRGSAVRSQMNAHLSIKVLDGDDGGGVGASDSLNLHQATEREIYEILHSKGTAKKEIQAAIEAIAYWQDGDRELTWKNLKQSTKSGKHKVKGFGKKTYKLLQELAFLREA